MGVVQVNETLLLLVVADGQGHVSTTSLPSHPFSSSTATSILSLYITLVDKNEIYIVDLNNNSPLFDGDVSALAGKPFTIIDCGASKSGNVRCLVQHIEDASLASTPVNPPANAPLHFVRESEGMKFLFAFY